MLSDIPMQLGRYWQALQPQADVPEFMHRHLVVDVNDWPSSFEPEEGSNEAFVFHALRLLLSNEPREGVVVTASSSAMDGLWSRGASFAVMTRPAMRHRQLGCEVVAMRSTLRRVQFGPVVPEGDGLIGGFLGVVMMGEQRGEQIEQRPLLGFRLRLETDNDIDTRPKVVRDFWGSARRMLGAS